MGLILVHLTVNDEFLSLVVNEWPKDDYRTVHFDSDYSETSWTDN